ncbi:MAG TPA: hypothetical protein VM840_13615 [Actinomycetota bacterium]|nr:hypothetical protein [Actinomycetota bacterium]
MPDKKMKQGSTSPDEAKAAEDEKGYLGQTPDPTPNEHYTVPGVLAGKPTPETDDDLAAKAKVNLRS